MSGHERIAAGQCSCGATYSLRWMTWDEWWEDHVREAGEGA